MARLEGGLAIVAASAIGVLMTACGGNSGTVTKSQQNFTLTIASSNPASGVAIGMTTNGSTSSLAETTPATVTGAASTTYALTAPATAGGNNFSSWTGCTGAGTTSNICEVTLNSNMTVTANYSTPTLATPTVTVSAPTSVQQGAAFSVTITVAAPAGGATPTGLVSLISSGLAGLEQPLTNGSVTVSVAAGAWTVAAGTYTLTATYTPDTNSSSTYNTATGTSGNITVTAAPPTTYTLTVDSTNPASGVAITASPADVNSKSSGSTSFALTYDSGAAVTLTAPATAGGNAFGSWTGCGSTSGTGGTVCSVTVSANTTVTANYTTSTTLITPTVTVTPASPSVNTQQSLDVTVTVGAPSGDPTPTGTVVLSNGNGYTSTATALSGGTVTITVPAGSLSQGLNTLTGTYTPDSGSSATYTPASGTHAVTVNTITPMVTVTPQSNTISNSQALQVTVTVAGPSGDATPTGSVTLTSGTYSSGAQTLTSGSVTITIAAGTLPDGSETLTATYTPDTASASLYGTASGTSSAVTVGAGTTVSVNQSSAGPATTPNILGVNLEAWYDDVGNASAINAALGPPGSTNTGGAGMAAIRWPGGSWSDDYHWGYQTGSSTLVAPYKCNCTTKSGVTTCAAISSSNDWAGYSTFAQFENAIPKAGNFDLALTANYGTNETCTGGGDPSEAAAFAGAAVTDGHPASHMTVGNEVYGAGWEDDLHAKAHDPTTYANAVTGADGNGGYYPLIKAASATTLVGVVVDADGNSSGWDHTVLSGAKGDYDFVEYHYYPQYNTVTSDYNLVHVYGPALTTNINTIKSELSTAGEASTPIYVGELGGNSGLEGTQGWSITQGLFAGQVLGEAMNDGVSRLTWWDGFGNCQGAGNNSANLYGWQNTWGAENIFSDADPNCPGEGAIGTLSPTARAFQLFSYVAVNGESVLPATVTGADTTDVKAYAATHSGGTALVLFNLNATTAEPVNITLSSARSTTDMQVITYDKEIYDYTNVNCQADSGSTFTPYPCTYDSTHNYSTAVWAPPATTDLGAQSLPYTLVLQPWSINVVIIK